MSTKLERLKEKSRKRKLKQGKPSLIRNVIVIALIAIASLTFISHFVILISLPVTIRANSIHIHQGTPLLLSTVSLITGGYEVPFDDIADIELLRYSARELGDMIDDLRVPRPRSRGRYIREWQGYSGIYRLHVALNDGANRTIWITRYSGGPVLISRTNGWETINLYERLVEEIYERRES